MLLLIVPFVTCTFIQFCIWNSIDCLLVSPFHALYNASLVLFELLAWSIWFQEFVMLATQNNLAHQFPHYNSFTSILRYSLGVCILNLKCMITFIDALTMGSHVGIIISKHGISSAYSTIQLISFLRQLLMLAIY